MYIDKSELIDRFGETEIDQLLLSDEGDGEAGESKVTAAIAEASQLIDASLSAGGYETPIPGTAPGLVKRLAADIARYYLQDNHATEEVRNRYKDAKETLEKIALGKMKLPIDEAEGQSEPTISVGGMATGDGSSNLGLEHY